MIQSTKDYNIFKLHASNRSVKPAHVELLKQSISEDNKLSVRPIIVDANMNVLDGQHRLEAARKLQIPVYYEIQKDLDINHVILLNKQKSWTLDDFFNFFIKEQYPEYLKLYKFMSTYELGLREALILLGQSHTSGNKLTAKGNLSLSKSDKFRQGKFLFPVDDMTVIQERIEYIDKIKKYLVRYARDFRKYVSQPLFNKALIEFISNKSIDRAIFLKKMEYCLDMFHPCRTVALYDQMLKSVYNYKNHNPIE